MLAKELLEKVGKIKADANRKMSEFSDQLVFVSGRAEDVPAVVGSIQAANGDLRNMRVGLACGIDAEDVLTLDLNQAYELGEWLVAMCKPKPAADDDTDGQAAEVDD